MKRNVKRIIVAAVWLACGLYTWGTGMAELNWRNTHNWSIMHWTQRDNVGIVAVESAIGPFGAVVLAMATNFNQHGWTLWNGNTAPSSPARGEGGHDLR